MAQVYQPQKKDYSSLLPLMGAGAAGAMAIPTGGLSLAAMPAIMGAAGTGAALGGVAKTGVDMLGNNQAQGGVPNGAVDRRMQGGTPQLPDQRQIIDNARIALQSQPAEVQQQYGPMLTAASLRLRREGGQV